MAWAICGASSRGSLTWPRWASTRFWLSPFYPSALTDGGYDVDDYRDVDPRLGTLADFDELTARLHANGIRVIVNIVPNHTSSRHAWFREALAAPKGSPARSRYIFRDGLGPDGAEPPSDWISVFGGPPGPAFPTGSGICTCSPPHWTPPTFPRSSPSPSPPPPPPARGPRHSLRSSSRTRSTRGPQVPRRAVMAAGSRCRGQPTARRSGSGPVPPTCRSRPGSARSASRPRREIRPRP